MTIALNSQNKSSKQIFFVLEDHPEIGENNCIYLQKIEPLATCILIDKPKKAREILEQKTPAIFVIDLQIGNLAGEQSARDSLELLTHLFKNYPALNILVYSSEYSCLRPLKKLISMHQGGFVVISKMERRVHFIQGAKYALAGHLVLPPSLRQGLDFSYVETQILQLLCTEYLTDQAIAQELNVSVRKVQKHIQQLKLKLDIYNLDGPNHTSSRVALSMEATRRRLLSI